eukprot:2286653-Rhodomonas_salina.1
MVEGMLSELEATTVQQVASMRDSDLSAVVSGLEAERERKVEGARWLVARLVRARLGEYFWALVLEVRRRRDAMQRADSLRARGRAWEMVGALARWREGLELERNEEA